MSKTSVYRSMSHSHLIEALFCIPFSSSCNGNSASAESAEEFLAYFRQAGTGAAQAANVQECLTCATNLAAGNVPAKQTSQDSKQPAKQFQEDETSKKRKRAEGVAGRRGRG